MPLTPSELNLLQELYKQNETLLDQLNKTEQWYKTLAPLFYTLAGALVTYLAQINIFKRTEKKEIKREISKLIGEFTYWSKEYAVAYYHFGIATTEQAILQYRLPKLRENRVVDYVNHELEEKIDKDEKHLEEAVQNREKKVLEYRKTRNNAFKYLTEVTLHQENAELEKLRKTFHNINIETIKDNMTLAELQNPKLFDTQMGKIRKQVTELAFLSDDVIEAVRKSLRN